jgi:hypothetical protein
VTVIGAPTVHLSRSSRPKPAKSGRGGRDSSQPEPALDRSCRPWADAAASSSQPAGGDPVSTLSGFLTGCEVDPGGATAGKLCGKCAAHVILYPTSVAAVRIYPFIINMLARDWAASSRNQARNAQPNLRYRPMVVWGPHGLALRWQPRTRFGRQVGGTGLGQGVRNPLQVHAWISRIGDPVH